MKDKRVCWVVFFIYAILCSTLFAQSVSQLISYQGRLTDSSGQPLDGVTVDIVFSFYGTESGGTEYISVTQEDVLVVGGIYNVVIGDGTINPGTESTLADVFQKHTDVWMGIKVGADPEMTPRTLVASVPYALAIDVAFLGDFLGKPDFDGDGFMKDLFTESNVDCNDGNPNIFPSAPELCDGLDNQCPGDPGYGTADEGCPGGCQDGDTASCPYGLPGICGVGLYTCSGGAWGSCQQVNFPGLESCNGVDDNCDSSIDEDWPTLGDGCSVSDGICKTWGDVVCTLDGLTTECDAVAGPADPFEVCDTLDNDCDTFVDEDFPDLGNLCSVGDGVCERWGLKVCKGDGTGTECSATEGPADPSESCDRLDNDCDTFTDEDFSDLGDVCVVGTGICERWGTKVCTGDGTGTECSAIEGPADPSESCDYLDNDCDTLTDEDFSDLGDVCGVGYGICERWGVKVCTGDGTGTECSVTPGPADPFELCDYLDNDCNDIVDEYFSGLGSPCVVGYGICERWGIKVCSLSGSTTECSATAGPADPFELCDGMDNDCDTLTDEDFTDLGDACSVGVGICERWGLKVCKGDGTGTECSAIEGSADPSESCDHLDNDCDTLIDEDFTDLGDVCSVGVGICERWGLKVCKGDGTGTECNATPGDPDPAETCGNGLDDDCNGVPDDGC